MKVKFCFLAALFLLFIVQSCSTVNIASNKEQGYTKRPKKVYAVVTCNTRAGVFCDGLVKGLQEKLSAKGISFESSKHTSLSLETDDDLNKKIDLFNPDAILMIRQSISGDEMGTFELTLQDVETKKNVWKSELNVSADAYTSIDNNDVIKKALKTLINKLTADNVI